MPRQKTIMLSNNGTQLEARAVRDGIVRVRYVSPVVSDWIKEEYDLAVMRKAGWQRVHEIDMSAGVTR